MTRKELIKVMDSVFGKGLNAALVAFRSPITNTLEERHIYADDCYEARLWADDKVDFYLNDAKLDFAVWINRHLIVSQGQLIIDTDIVDE
jgi:hypothetical protein